MFRIIITVIFLIAFAVLIVMNIGSTANVNVFGWKIDQLPVTAVAIVSFVGGVVYSFIFYLLSYLERGRRERLEKRKKKLKDQAADLRTREQQVDQLAEASRQQMAARDRESARKGSGGGVFARLFGRSGERTPEQAKPGRAEEGSS